MSLLNKILTKTQNLESVGGGVAQITCQDVLAAIPDSAFGNCFVHLANHELPRKKQLNRALIECKNHYKRLYIKKKVNRCDVYTLNKMIVTAIKDVALGKQQTVINLSTKLCESKTTCHRKYYHTYIEMLNFVKTKHNQVIYQTIKKLGFND